MSSTNIKDKTSSSHDLLLFTNEVDSPSKLRTKKCFALFECKHCELWKCKQEWIGIPDMCFECHLDHLFSKIKNRHMCV